MCPAECSNRSAGGELDFRPAGAVSLQPTPAARGHAQVLAGNSGTCNSSITAAFVVLEDMRKFLQATVVSGENDSNSSSYVLLDPVAISTCIV